MAEILITGASSFVGSSLQLDAKRPTHRELNLADIKSVNRYKWDGDIIIHCANEGHYKECSADDFKKNLAMMANIRCRWPEAKIIAFGSGAMHDKTRPIRHASEFDISYPTEYYGLSKRATVGLADVTLIPFGIYGNNRFIKAVRENPNRVTIYQDVLFSWVNASDLTRAVTWSMDKTGRFNLCGYDMTLTEMARHEGAKSIIYLQPGMGNEYTGRKSIVPLTPCPKD